MGNICRKKNKEYQDVTESFEKEELNIIELTSYGTLSDKTQDSLKRIENTKIKHDYENLVFAGGGLKGIAYCGALEILDHMGILKKIKRFACSSAGSIVATFLAIGYNPMEITSIMYDTDFSKFIDIKSIFKDVIHLKNNMGCCNGYALEHFIETYIEKKTGNKDYTFMNLYNDKNIELVITGTDLSRELTMYFNYKTHPHMPLKEAVRISTSIPILFEPVKHNNSYFCDGGLLDNYPIHAFDGDFCGDPNVIFQEGHVNPKTLGLKLMTNKERPNFSIVGKQKIKSLKNYVFTLIDTLYNSNERKFVKPSYWKRSILINTPDIPITQFNIMKIDKDRMVTNGRESVRKYFSNIN